MRHRRAGYKLGRTTAHRTATIRNLAAALFQHGQIVTTVKKAKAMQPFVERIVTLAKRGDLHSRRIVIARMGGDKHAFDWIWVSKAADDAEKAAVTRVRDRAEQFFPIPDSDTVERDRYGDLRKAPKLVKHIFDNVAPRFKDRAGGCTRIVKLAKRRIADGSELAVIQFVGAEEGPEIGGRVSTRRRIADRRTAFAAKLRKDFAVKAASADAAPANAGGEGEAPAAE